MHKVKAGIIGIGYIGVSHIEAIRRLGFVDLLAVSDADHDLALKKSDEYSIPFCYEKAEDLIADNNIDVVHNCTPTNLHTYINKAVILAKKHIFSEKPLAMDSSESLQLLKLLRSNPEVIHGINYVYRMNPLVQEIKNRIAAGDLGQPRLVHGAYLQDWLLFETDYNWRIEPEIGGASRCIADIGSHWMDCIQTVTGSKISEVCADLYIFHPVRKKPIGQVETFSLNKSERYEDVNVKTEDYGTVMFRMENGIHGVFSASEVSAGRKCNLDFEINGTKASVYWNQETSDRMWMGYKDKDNEIVMRNPLLMTKGAREYTYLAAGHPEGWNDAMKNNLYSFYKFIVDGRKQGSDKCDFATFDEGHYLVKLTEAILESSRTKKWIKVL